MNKRASSEAPLFMTATELHPVIAAAARGELPDWAQVSPDRVPHLQRVAALMEHWATSLLLDPRDRARWAAAAWLHDALRDADPSSLVDVAGEYPKKVRHGPAAAAWLRELGVNDEELLQAIAYHTIGHTGLGRLGRFLFMADYLEPGREFENSDREALRNRLPDDEADVLREVCARRIIWRLRDRKDLLRETVEFWNQLVADR
jgi:2-amino-4-hydroxy-6-hydroxymethyldihydropteridine diphosphokinase